MVPTIYSTLQNKRTALLLFAKISKKEFEGEIHPENKIILEKRFWNVE